MLSLPATVILQGFKGFLALMATLLFIFPQFHFLNPAKGWTTISGLKSVTSPTHCL